VLRIFERKRQGVRGGYRKKCTSSIIFYSLEITNVKKSRRMSWAEHVARMGKKRNWYTTVVVKSERKTPAGKT
jgi:hypothetical protein